MNLIDLLPVARSFLRSELDNVRRYDVPWRRRLWLYRNGFLSSKGAVWDLDEETVDQYLSDVEYRAAGRIDEPYGGSLKNKVLFHLVVSRTHGHLLPEVYGLVREGDIVDTGRLGELQSFRELAGLLEDERVVVKPVTAAKGDGVRILDRRDAKPRLRDGTDSLAETLDDDRDLLLVEHVGQADYASNIYPGATNSLRVLTMVDPQSGEPFIATATHRFGTAASGHIDNWSAGGISAGVDLDTGELESAVAPTGNGADRLDRVETHPDTGARIAGASVPEWRAVKDTVLELAATYGWLWPHVGWDVVVRDDAGSVAVLEGEPQSVDADQQAHEPLLAQERTRRFYEHHGVLGDGRGASSR